jgi:hypothetical protein
VFRTFKKKDLPYLRRVLAERRFSPTEEREALLLQTCFHLNHGEYRDREPHESGKVTLKKMSRQVAFV